MFYYKYENPSKRMVGYLLVEEEPEELPNGYVEITEQQYIAETTVARPEL